MDKLRVPASALYQVRRLYWQTVHPHTYGVKALVTHPEDPQQVLLIRQSYGDTNVWTFTGGAYRPKRETASQAARREVREEVGLSLGPVILSLSEDIVTSEGKIDHLTIVAAAALSTTLQPNYEVAEATWADRADISGTQFRGAILSRYVLPALAIYENYPNKG